MKALKNKFASISNSRWLAYTTAGVASAFAAANSAEATIHYSGPIKQIFKGCFRTASFQLDRPGDFIRLRHSSGFPVCSSSSFGNAFFNVAGIAGASIAGFRNDYGCLSASNLKRGQLISSRPLLPAQPWPSANLAWRDFNCPGQFRGRTGFIGFKFNNGSGDQYGWARVQVGGSHNFPFKLIDYAYGDVGDTIGAGQKSGHDKPELESLGGLALGAFGLLAWRKSRVRAAQ